MGGKHSDEFSQLFSSNINDRCAMVDWRNRSDERRAYQFNYHQAPCDNASIGDESFSKTLTFHLTNSVHLHDFELFSHHVKRSLRRLDCVQRNRSTVRRWHRAENEQINEILFSTDSSNRHVLIEIDEISVNSFHYDLIVLMPEDSDARRTISSSRFRSFLLKHQHPFEQLVLLFVSSLSQLRCPVVESLSTELFAIHSVETSSRLLVFANIEHASLSSFNRWTRSFLVRSIVHIRLFTLVGRSF